MSYQFHQYKLYYNAGIQFRIQRSYCGNDLVFFPDLQVSQLLGQLIVSFRGANLCDDDFPFRKWIIIIFSINEAIKFTIELPNEGQLPFLDTMVTFNCT